MRNLRTEFNQLMIYRDFTEVHQGFQKIMEVNRGSIPVFVYLETEEDPLGPEVASTVLNFEQELMGDEQVENAISVYDFYATIFALNQNLDHPQYPENIFAINMIYAISSEADYNPAENLVHREENIARILVSHRICKIILWIILNRELLL